jgi:uncharacterized protein
MWGAVHLLVSTREEEQAREHAQEAQAGYHHAAASHRRPLSEHLTSVEAWSDIAHNFRGDWQMLWKEIRLGFLIAGFGSRLPEGAFQAVLDEAPPQSKRSRTS